MLQLTLRLLVSDSLQLDEAEQIILSQELRWGYGSQPPLYTWLQAGVFTLTGKGVLGLSLVKNLLLFSIFALTWLAAKEITGSGRSAAFATLALVLLPELVWEAQRDLTHSVLVTALSIATTWQAARLMRRAASREYLVFGLVAGLGMLSKYNYLLFLGAFLGACLAVDDFRTRLLHRRMGWAAGGFLLVSGGHLLWMATHGAALGSQVDSLGMNWIEGFWAPRFKGVGRVASAVLLFLGPLLPLFLIARRQGSNPGSTDAWCAAWRKVFLRTIVYVVAICLVLALGFKVSGFKPRWMLPMLSFAPLLLVVIWGREVSRRALRNLAGFAMLVAVLILVLLPGRTYFAQQLGKFNRLNYPFAELAGELKTAGVFVGGIAGGDRLTGGNLALQFPGSRVTVPELAPFALPEPVLVVWDATRHPEPPADLIRLVQPHFPDFPGNARPDYVEALLKFGQFRSMRLGYYLLGQGGTFEASKR
ncbi:glycosyl transferase [Desulfuromonas versatilis]|uniref:Glycosyl transferase n=1 Tax=Desulfuromonas versatilis TaxID=2802975 RepID=A0ABN6DYE2_9BACT|nr:glycosyltransferase family 39 protein [Desulfuromonas versatilis]BCR05035.1 glycosyl transferase [Desulfuromonas versatilis]